MSSIVQQYFLIFLDLTITIGVAYVLQAILRLLIKRLTTGNVKSFFSVTLGDAAATAIALVAGGTSVNGEFKMPVNGRYVLYLLSVIILVGLQIGQTFLLNYMNAISPYVVGLAGGVKQVGAFGSIYSIYTGLAHMNITMPMPVPFNATDLCGYDTLSGVFSRPVAMAMTSKGSVFSLRPAYNLTVIQQTTNITDYCNYFVSASYDWNATQICMSQSNNICISLEEVVLKYNNTPNLSTIGIWTPFYQVINYESPEGQMNTAMESLFLLMNTWAILNPVGDTMTVVDQEFTNAMELLFTLGPDLTTPVSIIKLVIVWGGISIGFLTVLVASMTTKDGILNIYTFHDKLKKIIAINSLSGRNICGASPFWVDDGITLKQEYSGEKMRHINIEFQINGDRAIYKACLENELQGLIPHAMEIDVSDVINKF